MTVSTPPPFIEPPVQPVAPAQPTTPVLVPVDNNGGASGLAGTQGVSIDSTEIDESTQVNSSNSSQSNIQVNNAFQPRSGESLGGGIVLNNPLEFYGQITTDGNYTQGTIGGRWTPGRGRSARRILKKRQKQIDQEIILTQDRIAAQRFQTQLDLEKHCLVQAQQGYTSASCEGVITRVVKEEPAAQQRQVTHTVSDFHQLHNHTAPEPVRGRY